MKTNTILKVTHNSIVEYCRVKLDGKKFPYIVINNEKIILKSHKFPRKETVLYGLLELDMEVVKCVEELKAALSNPELTADKLSIQQKMRLG